MDPKTGKVTDHAVPVLKPEEPKGVLELKPDPDGNVWASMMYQGGIAKLDVKTGKVTTYKVPEQWQGPNTQESMVSPENWKVDGWVWTNDQQFHMAESRRSEGSEWQHDQRLRHPERQGQQSVPAGIRRHQDRQDRRQNEDAAHLGAGTPACASTPWAFRSERHLVVCGIWLKRGRPLRSEDRQDHRLAEAGEMADAL
jgi:hypothetical protein